jgi:hypothetical protein
LRQRTIQVVAQNWLKNDPTAAKAWLTSIGKSDLMSRF